MGSDLFFLMSKKYLSSSRLDISAALFSKVMEGIYAARSQQKRKLKQSFLIILTSLSFLSLIPAWLWVQAEAANQGFNQFLSILISDWNAIGAYFPDFSLSLLESFPFFSAIIFLALLFVTLYCLKIIATSFPDSNALQVNKYAGSR